MRKFAKLILACFLVLFFVTSAYAQMKSSPEVNQGNSSGTASILSRIETYKAPAYPAEGYITEETYDSRAKSGMPNPPSLTDAFIFDIWQRLQIDLKLSYLNASNVNENNILQAFDIYLIRDWQNIAGYRPWTHWNFIRSLSAGERAQLAKEVSAYISKYGVRER